MKKIPCFTFEEHNQAFTLWHEAAHSGIIKNKNNFLIHVDQHDDLRVPKINISINDTKDNLDLVKNIGYNELNIGNFIIPCVFNGLFDKICWIKQKHNYKRTKAINYVIDTTNDLGRTFNLTEKKYFRNNQGISKSFKYYLRTIEKIPNVSGKSVVLDIDLDYFSSNLDPGEFNEVIIEITKQEYLKYINNPINPIKLAFNKTLAKEFNKKYYLIFEYYKEVIESPLKVSENDILTRIEHFGNILKLRNVKPKLINICRSRNSGYTPMEQGDFIEKNLNTMLKSLYHLDQISYGF